MPRDTVSRHRGDLRLVGARGRGTEPAATVGCNTAASPSNRNACPISTVRASTSRSQPFTGCWPGWSSSPQSRKRIVARSTTRLGARASNGVRLCF
ncbi:MAG: hypothetical protein ABSF53_14260 [Terracidiphilus sp.]